MDSKAPNGFYLPTHFDMKQLIKVTQRYPINAARWFYLNDLRRDPDRFRKYSEYKACFSEELLSDLCKLYQGHS